jgi:hypothetical protein
MFNDKYGLTQAVLEGRKTMTRRICKYDRPDETYGIVSLAFEPIDYNNDRNVISTLDYAFCWKNNEGDFTDWNIPKYKVCEVVAIAQNYGDCGNMPDYELDEDGYPIMPKKSGFFNKMFVRADLMPHHIRIANIKIQRLQEISNEDCLKEGIEEHLKNVQYGFSSNIGYCGQYPFPNPREAFASLIDKVSGRGTWNNNPYVFAYEFELID